MAPMMIDDLMLGLFIGLMLLLAILLLAGAFG